MVPNQEHEHRVLGLVLDLEKKLETQNIEVRADFTRELQKIAKPSKPEVDPEKLQASLEGQIQNLETNFKNLFTRRIEIAEEGLDNMVRRIDKYMAAVSFDAEKAEKLESAIKDQIDLIQHINANNQKMDEELKQFGESLETRLERQKKELQGQMDSAYETNKKQHQFLEKELNSMRQMQLKSQSEFSEFKVIVVKSFEDTIEKQKILNQQTLGDMTAKQDKLTEKVNNFEQELQGSNFKMKTAISMIDNKQAKTVDVIHQLEQNINKKFDQKISFLENSDAQLQRDFGLCKTQIAE